MQQGGGIGHDFSTLRPKGAPVKSIGADASGPVSFMDVWDAMCRTIMSAGARRGAMMATLRCDHPDIEAFIDAKSDPARLRNFNLSVLVTDAFIAAVRNDAPWDLVFEGKVYRTVAGPRAVGPHHARDLRLCRARRGLHRPHQRREQPRLLRADQLHEPVRRTTPAAAWRLPAGLDQSGAPGRQAVRRRCAARRSPPGDAHRHRRALPRQRHRRLQLSARRPEAGGQGQAPHRARRDRAGRCADPRGRALRHARGGRAGRALDGRHRAGRLSRQRRAGAREGRVSALSMPSAFSPRRMCSVCPRMCARRSPQHGIRNGLLTSIAPTGTISLLAGNVSSGVEPVFDFRYERRVLERDGSLAHGDGRRLRARAVPREIRARGAAAAGIRDRGGAHPARASGDAGRAAAPCRQLHLQDHQLPGGPELRGLQGCLPAGLRSGAQGLHHLPPQRRDGRRC